ncbi:MAG: S41 family peptidase [Aggregatilineales bacterium]
MRNRSLLFSGLAVSAALAAILATAVPGHTPANAQAVSTGAATTAPTTVVTESATAAPNHSATGVTQIHGTVKITNQFILGDTAEPMIALIDLTAFIKRDHDLHLPFADQVIAGVYTDPVTGVTDLAHGAEYTMPLPIEPRGTINDVAHGKGGKGVMVFAADFDTNAIGDAFMGPHEWTGWPGGADGLEFDPGTYEVAQGEFLVWSPDDQQMFPTGFGPDGKLFTDDDPVGPIGKGWTVIKVDADKTKPFEQIRTAHAEIPMLEGLTANNDLSSLGYTAAFDELVKELKLRYVYTDFKHLDWNAMVSAIRPLVVTAEQDKSKDEFNIAILKFVALFHDGHVGTSTPQAYFTKQTSGGLGMVLGQTDDGSIIVSEVLPTLPAAKAGIKAGAQIIEWNGQPAATAVANTPLEFVTESSPIPVRLQQLRYILRSPVGTKVTIKFQNPGDSSPQTVDLNSIKEQASFRESSFFKGVTAADMPITYKLILLNNTAYGYVKINTFEGDSVLLTRLWESAINTFNGLNVPSLIVDVRQNGGGSGLLADYFAGSFYTSPFDLNTTYQADKNGKFVYNGKSVILPSPAQWTAPVAFLIGPACASACEIFSGAVAHDPNHLIVGRYPTAGIEASVEAWTLPDGLYFQAPTGRIMDPTNTKPFLEGVGVQPNVKVPVTAQSLLSTDDQELTAAEAALDAQIKTANGQ